MTKNPGSEWANSNPRMQIAQDLLGDWTVVKVFGRRNTAKGKILVKAFLDEEQATTYFVQECRRREQRGYELVPPFTIKSQQ